MWLVATVLLTVSSDTARNVLQDTFAAGSVVVANNLWLLLFSTIALAVLCLAYQTSKVRGAAARAWAVASLPRRI